eukprot:m.15250 g.15250  ORF g.15250 m.15250 type:complete len:313 (+) comp7348_c0_seq1:286-1224(+)
MGPGPRDARTAANTTARVSVGLSCIVDVPNLGSRICSLHSVAGALAGAGEAAAAAAGAGAGVGAAAAGTAAPPCFLAANAASRSALSLAIWARTFSLCLFSSSFLRRVSSMTRFISISSRCRLISASSLPDCRRFASSSTIAFRSRSAFSRFFSASRCCNFSSCCCFCSAVSGLIASLDSAKLTCPVRSAWRWQSISDLSFCPQSWHISDRALRSALPSPDAAAAPDASSPEPAEPSLPGEDGACCVSLLSGWVSSHSMAASTPLWPVACNAFSACAAEKPISVRVATSAIVDQLLCKSRAHTHTHTPWLLL